MSEPSQETKTLKRTAEEADLSEDDSKMRKLLKTSLAGVAQNLERENQRWIEARRHWIGHAVALLSQAEAKVQKVTTREGRLHTTSVKVILPGDKPAEGASIGAFSAHFTSDSEGIAGTLADITPELGTYFRKERSQILTYQNGNNFSDDL